MYERVTTASTPRTNKETTLDFLESSLEHSPTRSNIPMLEIQAVFSTACVTNIIMYYF